MSLMSSKKLLMQGARKLRPQDVFATALLGGVNGPQTVTTGFRPDLAWLKARNASSSHAIADSVRGGSKVLRSDQTAAEYDYGATPFATFLANGATVNTGMEGASNGPNALWLFRRAKKFLDIVRWTGDGASPRVIPHGLKATPGMIIVKRLDGPSNWPVWHRANPNGEGYLNRTDQLTYSYFAVDAADENSFRLSANSTFNGSVGGAQVSANLASQQYEALIFAHNPDLIQCGRFTKSGNRTPVVLGWRPQFLMVKRANAAGAWEIYDSARGFPQNTSLQQNAKVLFANASQAEAAEFSEQSPTGFLYSGGTDGEYIFKAIREPT